MIHFQGRKLFQNSLDSLLKLVLLKNERICLFFSSSADPFSEGVYIQESKLEVTTIVSLVKKGNKFTKCIQSLQVLSYKPAQRKIYMMMMYSVIEQWRMGLDCVLEQAHQVRDFHTAYYLNLSLSWSFTAQSILLRSETGLSKHCTPRSDATECGS